jgi:hypothetical protein
MAEEGRLNRLSTERIARMPARAQAGERGGAKPPSGFRWAADGSLKAIPGGPADKQAALEEKAAEKKKAGNDKAVVKYSDTLEKHGIPEFETALSALEGQLGKYPAGKAPGLGRGVGLIPDWMQGKEGENIRQALAAVKNTLLKARSGAAVTESELRRFVEELGSGGFRSEETLRTGIKRIRDRFEKVKENTVAGVNDDVKDQYEQQGGMRINRGNEPTLPKIPEGAIAAERARRAAMKGK